MYQRQANDELRARFTQWMKVLAYRTRHHYLRIAKRKPIEASIDEVGEEYWEVPEEQWTRDVAFEFEEERLAQAFSQLPDAKKKVLTMLFVLEESPEEVAGELGCTVQNVYNQRSQALKRLRAALEGGECNDK